MKKLLGSTLLVLTLALQAISAHAQSREDARLITATQVLQELHASPDQNIPAWLMERAYGVAVIPDVIKGAFIFGGRHGNGVLSVRDAAGRFSNPIFLSLTGGSVGWQFGAQATDVVLIFTTRRSVDTFARGQFTLGVSASVAAGPLGRQGEAAAGKSVEVYSYSRSRGLFAGAALDGTALRFERASNRRFYGRDVTAAEISSGAATTSSESARRFIAAIATTLPAGSPGTPAPGAAATPIAPAETAAPQPATSPGAQTFPLEDAQPGGEPR